ncbi:MAG TPA: Hsp20/alpha crystallin family protein [Thermoanaerobaculia bacterium]|nr:Hsp20/alpha crystallin family protein [Thermoanaerobaculia bacterium]
MTLLTRFNRFDPFEDLNTIKNQFDRILARINPEFDEELLTTPWMPAADVIETKDAINIKVEMENGVLTLTGERKTYKELPEKGYKNIERFYGTFTRNFVLPPNVDFNKITATYVNGLLELTLPKKEEAKPKTIHVEVKKLPIAA